MTIKEWLGSARKKFEGANEFSILDLELILCRVLDIAERSYLVLHENDALSEWQVLTASKLAERRFLNGEPLAYIFSEKEFYGRKFFVDERVLIPRPETETLIEATKEIIKSNNDLKSVLDVGTGSGIIAATIKLELPKMDVQAVDISDDALTVARRNADTHDVKISIFKSDLLKNVATIPDVIVANLPYVDKDWDFISKNLRFEPKLALFAEDGGLFEIKRLIKELCERFSRDETGRREVFLLLELDPSQKKSVENYIKGSNKKYNLKFQKMEFDDYQYVLCYKITRQR